jgi:anaerobic selenocysteine-containing dehydrogenase
MISSVDNGVLKKVTGDLQNGFTKGHLCAKGYAYTQYVYNPLRLKYPLLQTPRGSGNWKVISWDEAYQIIAKKILELNSRYGSNLACGYNKFSGNLGILHYATEGMFNSIGPHTKPFGNVCLSTGAEAVKELFGKISSPIPEDMAKAKLIVIWGANPAITNIHQMKFINEAKENGGKMVVIDPIFSETAAKADIYVQIKPGSDALLAFGISKLLIESNQISDAFIKENTIGWQDYYEFIRILDIETVCKETGVSIEILKKLADLYARLKPVATWNGFGIQRNKYGGQSIKAINSLVALSGNLFLPHGGVYFTHSDIEDFPLTLLNFPEKKHPIIKESRYINSSNFAAGAKDLINPPLKFLWIASRSPLSQDQNLKAWEMLLEDLELIVTVDLFMTKTAEQSDLVLPAASHFEEEDLNVGYWHHWLSINEKSLPPFFDAKSDLQIARELSKKLNELCPGFSTFPYELEPIDWIQRELTTEIKNRYGIRSYEDLIEGPRHIKEESASNFPQNEKFVFFDPNEKNNLLSEIVENHNEENESYPFRLLSPQSLLKIHSQFSVIPWLHPEPEQTTVEMNKTIAEVKGISEGSKVKVFNQNGSVTALAKFNLYLPNDVIIVKQTETNSINQLISYQMEDESSPMSTHFYDSYVDITKLEVSRDHATRVYF